MKNCGRRFHNEVGKYRFLNELIKVVSPKVSSLWIGPYFMQIKHLLTVCPAIQPFFFLNHLLFPVHGWQRAWESEDEDCRDAVQLDGGISKWNQDQRSLPDAEKAGCVEMLNIMHVKRHPPQRKLINPVLTLSTRPRDTGPRVTAGQDSDSFSSDTP